MKKWYILDEEDIIKTDDQTVNASMGKWYTVPETWIGSEARPLVIRREIRGK